jgi:hypothetical protein
MNFSVLGVVLILTIGGMIIITRLCVDIMIGWQREKHEKKTWEAQQWGAEETLRLQRSLLLHKQSWLQIIEQESISIEYGLASCI